VGVIIGIDPHKRSATIEVIDDRAAVLVAGRFGTDKAGPVAGKLSRVEYTPTAIEAPS